MGNEQSGVWHHPECGACSFENCPAKQHPDDLALRGWRLGVGAIVVFVVPCLSAILGAAAGTALGAGQLTGAIAGLATAMGGVTVVARLCGREEATA